MIILAGSPSELKLPEGPMTGPIPGPTLASAVIEPDMAVSMSRPVAASAIEPRPPAARWRNSRREGAGSIGLQSTNKNSLRVSSVRANADQAAWSEPDAAALSAIVKSRQGIRRLSAERVRKELLVLLGAANPVPALQLMQSHGVLADSLAGVPNVPRLERFLRLEAKTRSEADPVLRLAVLAIAGDTWASSTLQ